MKPHTILLLSALLAICAAIFLTVANHEPKAALAAGYALLVGLISLALYLSNRQRTSQAETKLAKADASAKRGEQSPRVRTEKYNKRLFAPAPAGEAKAKPYPNYTSHSRA